MEEVLQAELEASEVKDVKVRRGDRGLANDFEKWYASSVEPIFASEFEEMNNLVLWTKWVGS